MIRLPGELVERCRDYGRMVVGRYASGQSEASRAYSYRDADKNTRLWAEAKMAECIFAKESGVSCETLNWAGVPDWYDVALWDKRIDVKSTGLHGQYLIWPIAKNSLYEGAHFDCLVLTKVSPDGEGYSAGYISKRDFSLLKRTADESHRLDAGTWFVEEPDLDPVEQLVLQQRRAELEAAREAIRQGKQFEFVSGQF